MASSHLRAVIPMKPLAQCKLRLIPVLDGAQRAQLALAMLGRVAAAARDANGVVDVAVLGGDEVIRERCRWLDIAWYPDAGDGLNAALQSAYGASRERGLDGMLYLAGDLPALQAEDVNGLLTAFEGQDLVLAAGARGGTNAIVLRHGLPFTFKLGEHSLQQHEIQAAALGLRWRRYEAAAIYTDLDLPDDVARLRREAPALWQALTGSGARAAAGAAERTRPSG